MYTIRRVGGGGRDFARLVSFSSSLPLAHLLAGSEWKRNKSLPRRWNALHHSVGSTVRFTTFPFCHSPFIVFCANLPWLAGLVWTTSTEIGSIQPPKQHSVRPGLCCGFFLFLVNKKVSGVGVVTWNLTTYQSILLSKYQMQCLNGDTTKNNIVKQYVCRQ